MREVKYLDVSSTAKRFGVSIGTIYRYIREGKIRAVRAGAHRACELASVREWFSDDPELRHILDRTMEEVTAD